MMVEQAMNKHGHMFLHFKSIIKVYIHPSVSNDSAYTKHHFDPVLYRQRAIYWAKLFVVYVPCNIFVSTLR